MTGNLAYAYTQSDAISATYEYVHACSHTWPYAYQGPSPILPLIEPYISALIHERETMRECLMHPHRTHCTGNKRTLLPRHPAPSDRRQCRCLCASVCKVTGKSVQAYSTHTLNCTRCTNNCYQERPKMNTTDVIAKTIYDRLVLVSGPHRSSIYFLYPIHQNTHHPHHSYFSILVRERER